MEHKKPKKKPTKIKPRRKQKPTTKTPAATAKKSKPIKRTFELHSPKVITRPSLAKRIMRQLTSRPPKKRLMTVATIGGFMLFFGAIAITTYEPAVETSDPLAQINFTIPEPPEPEPETIPSPLSGLEVPIKAVDTPITAVMIENSIDARPQSGLEASGMVFEAIAEGGITRFLAVYQHEEPERLGPIRSARPYYVRWAAGFDARYVHSGGSPEALALIPSLGVNDLDHGRYGDQLATRVSNRFAPHNVYTTPAVIDSVGTSAGFTSSDYEGLKRKEAAPSEAPTASKIDMNISGFNYNTSYTYRADENDYARVMAGQKHVDGDSGKQITPEVVVALEMGYGIHPNGIHSVYDSVGTGNALIFQDGEVTKATWRKTSNAGPLTLVDSAGDAVPINPGQTWFTAIQPGRVTYN